MDRPTGGRPSEADASRLAWVKYADWLEAQLKYKTSQWEGVKDMLATELTKNTQHQATETAAQAVIDGMKPSYTTAKNSSAVRKGFEVSGSIRHYKCRPYQIHALMNALEAGDE
jgi:hypothetical protein